MTMVLVFAGLVSGQGVQPYPKAITDRLIHQKSPMRPRPVNTVFKDPDFGSLMVRVTDATTNYKLPDTFLRTEASGKANEWSADGHKFYVMGSGGQILVFGFDPSTMKRTYLPGAKPGQGRLVPLGAAPTFSFTDPDLIYGTSAPLVISRYHFSTGVRSTVIDTTSCGTRPALIKSPDVGSDADVSLSASDNRISISEGGPPGGKHMFVVVYDKQLGCRWYNTETGEIGGEWGPSGTVAIPDRFFVTHVYLSRNGRYIQIPRGAGFSVWDVPTLNVTSCKKGSGLECAGYSVLGYKSFVNGPGVIDDMQMAKRPLSNLAQITQLIYPLLPPHHWGQSQQFTWSNVDAKDSVPVCGSTYSYDGDPTIDQPFAGEVFCVETDGLASTVWRFAHNRATYIPRYFQTQPLGSVSRDGRFLLFTSNWDAQLGIGSDGKPRSDVFIVKLE
ncbi:MAG: hypothetical protein DMG89_04820 [Acidobacteria bacterium]|nr:MAG: hypothetical protein DMG89_04820 [Acidobacteriota bacterium]